MIPGRPGLTSSDSRRRSTRGLKAKNPVVLDWPASRKSILEADPLYESMASAESPDELYDLLLRKEIETLFKDEAKLTHDIFRYADIALDLGQPGFAAMLYWNAKRSIKPEAYGNRNLDRRHALLPGTTGHQGREDRFPRRPRRGIQANRRRASEAKKTQHSVPWKRPRKADGRIRRLRAGKYPQFCTSPGDHLELAFVCAGSAGRSNGSSTGCTKLKSCTRKPFVPTKKLRLAATSRL